MRYLKRFNEDQVIDHFAFLKDIGFHIFKPMSGRYIVHKMVDISSNYRIIDFKIGEIKDEIVPIFRLFNVEKITLSSYRSYDDDVYTIEEFDLLDDNMEFNRLFFDIG